MTWKLCPKLNISPKDTSRKVKMVHRAIKKAPSGVSVMLVTFETLNIALSYLVFEDSYQSCLTKDETDKRFDGQAVQ